MDSDVLDKLRREEAELTQKLEAVRMLLRAYGAYTSPLSAATVTSASPAAMVAAEKPTLSSREKVPIDRFGDYGRSVVQAAIDECRSHVGSPIASRDMVALVERRGIEVRGNDKVNAISALLARSLDLRPNGRKGWTLSDEFLESEQRMKAALFGEENEPHSANAGGSETAQDAPKEETTEW